jgi:hypothetical protein
MPQPSGLVPYREERLLLLAIQRSYLMNRVSHIIPPNWHPGRAAIAGAVATLVYSVSMEGDKFLTGNHFNDVRFIEGLLAGEKREKRFSILAWIIHFLTGIALAEIYAAMMKRFLPGPNWLKGTIFGEMFITSLWWLTPLADKYHPLIKNGEMPKLANWTSFFQNMIRHLVFGLTLGLLYRD